MKKKSNVWLMYIYIAVILIANVIATLQSYFEVIDYIDLIQIFKLAITTSVKGVIIILLIIKAKLKKEEIKIQKDKKIIKKNFENGVT